MCSWRQRYGDENPLSANRVDPAARLLGDRRFIAIAVAIQDFQRDGSTSHSLRTDLATIACELHLAIVDRDLVKAQFLIG